MRVAESFAHAENPYRPARSEALLEDHSKITKKTPHAGKYAMRAAHNLATTAFRGPRPSAGMGTDPRLSCFFVISSSVDVQIARFRHKTRIPADP